MEQEYLNRNIVFIGDFKPSYFDKLLFIKGDLLKEDDFLEGSIFSPDLTIIDTKKLVIEINQNRFTINFKVVKFEINIENLIELLKTSQVRAFGFNFKRVLFLDDLSSSKKYFYFEQNVLNKHFHSADTAYGYYISRDFEESRLKLDIKPVILQKVNENIILTALDFNFNFHFDNIKFDEKLRSYKNYEQLTLDIANSYE